MAPVTMVDRFTSIIDVFDDTTTGLSLDQVATRADLPRSTTHRILDHLVRLQWLTHSDRGYGLGARALAWGAGDASDLRLREAAGPVLHDLYVRTGAVAQLGVLVGRPGAYDVVHVDKLGGASAARVPTAVGTRVSAHRLALGLAVLSVLPPEHVPAVEEHLHRVRRVGGLVRYDEYARGLTSVAATVDDRCAIGIVLCDRGSGERLLPVVLDAAARVRSALR
jgi:DNA-binding IclR family transcriptional regulator